jgi:hypothetical protein
MFAHDSVILDTFSYAFTSFIYLLQLTIEQMKITINII